ncbi:MAG: hypothetical protein RIC55_34155 [Pirellulaceae bacterium]
MTTSPEPIVLSWSGGKDSSLALDALKRDGRYKVVALLCSIAAEYQRISHHGVRVSLLERQAEAIGIPLHKLELPAGENGPCTNEQYEQIMSDAMLHFRRQGVRSVAFGDIFLEDLRAYREKNLARVEMRGLFPLWKRDTRALVEQFIDQGFRAYTSCVEGELGPELVGRRIDRDFLAELPPGVDPCGENGEYHTFVYAGPVFRAPLSVRVGETVCRDTRYYADLLPDDSPSGDAACDPINLPPV